MHGEDGYGRSLSQFRIHVYSEARHLKFPNTVSYAWLGSTYNDPQNSFVCLMMLGTLGSPKQLRTYDEARGVTSSFCMRYMKTASNI